MRSCWAILFAALIVFATLFAGMNLLEAAAVSELQCPEIPEHYENNGQLRVRVPASKPGSCTSPESDGIMSRIKINGPNQFAIPRNFIRKIHFTISRAFSACSAPCVGRSNHPIKGQFGLDKKGVPEFAGDLFALRVEENRADQVAPYSPPGENT